VIDDYDHRYCTTNTGLEAPLHGWALLIVPEVINFSRCIVLLPWLLALFIEGCKLSDFSEAVNKASRGKDLYLPHEAIVQSLNFNITSTENRETLRNIRKRYTNSNFVTTHLVFTG